MPAAIRAAPSPAGAPRQPTAVWQAHPEHASSTTMAGCLIPGQEGSLTGVALPATDRFTVLLPIPVPVTILPVAAAKEHTNVVQLPPAEVDQPISVLPQLPGTGVTPLLPGAHSRTALRHTALLRGATAPPTRLQAAALHPAPVHPVAVPDHPVAAPVVDAGKQV